VAQHQCISQGHQGGQDCGERHDHEFGDLFRCHLEQMKWPQGMCGQGSPYPFRGVSGAGQEVGGKWHNQDPTVALNFLVMLMVMLTRVGGGTASLYIQEHQGGQGHGGGHDHELAAAFLCHLEKLWWPHETQRWKGCVSRDLLSLWRSTEEEVG